MYDWLEEEELDVEAMIESINSLMNLFIRKEKNIDKQSKLQKEISTLQDGKKTFKSVLSFKSSNKVLGDQEKQLEQVFHVYIGYKRREDLRGVAVSELWKDA